MLNETYPAQYRDRFGEVATTIQNNGHELHMTLRGVEFTGAMLDDWEMSESADAGQVQQFTLNHGVLCDFVLEFALPIPIGFQTERLQGMLHIRLTLGAPASNGGVDQEILSLRLDVADSSFSSQDKDGWFEDALLEINRQLPEGMYLQTCFGCAFSDYYPAGYGLFGALACFRDNKQHYLAARGKQQIMKLWKTRTEFVQETYHCDEFERRMPGTGYRG